MAEYTQYLNHKYSRLFISTKQIWLGWLKTRWHIDGQGAFLNL